MSTQLIYPVCVFFVDGKFFSHVPSVGEVDEFCDNYIESNNLPESTEVFFYDRKVWIGILRDVKKDKLKFVIEGERICTYTSEEVEEDVQIDFDWMKEDKLEAHYTASEIVKINANKAFIQDNNIAFLTDEIIATFPHAVADKKRAAKIKVLKDKLVTAIAGEKKV